MPLKMIPFAVIEAVKKSEKVVEVAAWSKAKCSDVPNGSAVIST